MDYVRKDTLFKLVLKRFNNDEGMFLTNIAEGWAIQSHLWNTNQTMARSTSSNPRYTASQITTAVTTTVGMTLTLLMMGLLIVMAYLGSQWEKQLRQEARVQVFFQRELDSNLLLDFGLLS